MEQLFHCQLYFYSIFPKWDHRVYSKSWRLQEAVLSMISVCIYYSRRAWKIRKSVICETKDNSKFFNCAWVLDFSQGVHTSWSEVRAETKGQDKRELSFYGNQSNHRKLVHFSRQWVLGFSGKPQTLTCTDCHIVYSASWLNNPKVDHSQLLLVLALCVPSLRKPVCRAWDSCGMAGEG